MLRERSLHHAIRRDASAHRPADQHPCRRPRRRLTLVDALPAALVLLAGIAAGTISAIVGGAAIVTFPALLGVGVPAILATAATTVALTPSLFLAAWCERPLLPPLDRAFLSILAASMIGSLIGAALLLLTPARLFEGLIPILIGFATVLFAQAPRLARWIAARATSRGHWMLVALLVVSIYGGYFGAGIGVLLLGVLSVESRGDYRSANATKNLVSALGSAVASAIFIAQDAVVWSATLLMTVGTLAGSLIGVRLARVMPNQAARTLVVGAGVLLTAFFAARYWLRLA